MLPFLLLCMDCSPIVDYGVLDRRTALAGLTLEYRARNDLPLAIYVKFLWVFDRESISLWLSRLRTGRLESWRMMQWCAVVVAAAGVLCFMVPESSCQCSYGCVCRDYSLACYSIASLDSIPHWNKSLQRMWVAIASIAARWCVYNLSAQF